MSLLCTDTVGQPASAGTIHRGDGVSCTASALAGIRRIKSWKFASLDSSLKTNRAETDPDSTHFSNVWAGQMVTSGTVTVQAKVGTDSTVRSATARVTVLPRDWVHAGDPNYVPVPGWPALPRYVHQGDLSVVPENVHELRHTVWAFLGNGVVDSTGSQGTIVTGPNSPVFFVAKMPPVLDSLIIQVNDSALAPHSIFWNIQPAFDPNKTYSRVPCFQEDVTSPATLSSIQAHEGTQWDPGSHAAALRHQTFSQLVPAAESVYAKITPTGGVAPLRNRWESVMVPVIRRIVALARDTVDKTNPVVFGSSARNNVGCRFKYHN